MEGHMSATKGKESLKPPSSSAALIKQIVQSFEVTGLRVQARAMSYEDSPDRT